MGVVDQLNKENFKKSLLKDSADINGTKWHKGQVVICRMEEEIFKAELFGFYENSAVVYNLYNKRLYCCSFRNILDTATMEPLRPTPKKEAVTLTYKYKTAYLPTDEEREEWRKEAKKHVTKYKPRKKKKYNTVLG